jgi:hypothetical protein
MDGADVQDVADHRFVLVVLRQVRVAKGDAREDRAHPCSPHEAARGEVVDAEAPQTGIRAQVVGIAQGQVVSKRGLVSGRRQGGCT